VLPLEDTEVFPSTSSCCTSMQ